MTLRMPIKLNSLGVRQKKVKRKTTKNKPRRKSWNLKLLFRS